MFELTSKGWPNQPQVPTLPHFRGPKLVVLLLVFCLHGALAWQVLLVMNQHRPESITPPTIQGVMILSKAPPVLVMPPKPVVKPPLPTPAKPVTTIPPVKNAPPSEKAITQSDVASVVEKTPPKEEVLPEVAPQPALHQPVKEAETIIPPRELRINQSSGYKRLDDAAVQAVKKWQYVPARRGNEAISFWYIQPLSFSLNS